MKRILTVALVCSIFFASAQEKAPLHIRIYDDNTGKLVACNARLWSADNKPLFPDSTYYWKSFEQVAFPEFPCAGEIKMALKPGRYYYQMDRGPEYFLVNDSLDIDSTGGKVEVRLKRLANMAKRKWWSGELHVHRPVQQIELLMKASDLHIAPVITSWNEHYNVSADSIYDPKPKNFDGSRYYTTQGSEDERGGGAILAFNTTKPVNFSQFKDMEYPSLVYSADHVSTHYGDNTWIDVEKPFWWDLPLLIASGRVNSVGVAHNHMHKEAVFDNEAWGRPRDRKKYPSPWGNGLYTHDIYFKLLNCGIRMPPSAGSASGVLLNPVGYNRMYVNVEGKLSYEKWFEGVKAGKLFVTNGPMLLVRANAQWPGYIFKEKKEIVIKGELLSRDSIDRIEIIKNGVVVQVISAGELKGPIFTAKLSTERGGWFVVRALCKSSNNFRFAMTAPWYIEEGGARMISKSSAEYFLEWTKEREALLKVKDETQQQEIQKYIHAAKQFWQQLAAKANAE